MDGLGDPESHAAWSSEAACEISDPFSNELGVGDWLDPLSFDEEDTGLPGYSLDTEGLGLSDEAHLAAVELAGTSQLADLDDVVDAPCKHSVRMSAMRASFSMNDLMGHSGQLSSGPWLRHAGATPQLEPVPEGAPAPGTSIFPSPATSTFQNGVAAAAQSSRQGPLPPHQHAFIGSRQQAFPMQSDAVMHAPPFPIPSVPHNRPPTSMVLGEQRTELPAMTSDQPAPAVQMVSALQQGQHTINMQAHAGGDAEERPGGMRKSHSALELGAWRQVAAGELDAFVDENTLEQLHGLQGRGGITMGRLTPEERLQKILRYRAKRQMRNFNRTIKYQCRKSLADTRPRVRGRFARDNEPGSVMPHETKKAQREKGRDGVPGSSENVATDSKADVCVKPEPGREAEPSGSATSAGTSTQMQHESAMDNKGNLETLFNQWAEMDASNAQMHPQPGMPNA
uniref:CCT domain-containing protein n=1 Tax=Chlamydomonas euryale TaxID=1486919 RepID=A0A7R9V378_9CHLO|mmetsp:Transcript_16128/g.47933  ORF Transcript_16128/g.47933 Transcript_16128/m.47933 type:complete len:454 (+) Transcript_16128:211-1572(+)